MFAESANTDRTKLKQGDIVDKVPLLGALNPNAFSFINNAGGEQAGWQVPMPLTYGLAAILSHSCEIAPENGVKLTSIVLAPLRSADTASSPEKLAQLRETNLLSEAKEASFLKYFFLPGGSPLPDMPKGYVVDFSKCFSVRKNFYGKLLEGKLAEMLAGVQGEFALKLAVFFSRAEERKAA